ncbi:phytanoyl-CoA dioxygenase family protein [Pseudomonas sp. TE3610]
MNNPPIAAYGILHKTSVASAVDEVVEQVKNLGYAILHSGYLIDEIKSAQATFTQARKQYAQRYGLDALVKIDEANTIRAPILYGEPFFLHLALNQKLLSVIEKLIVGKFILNQQNGLINPPKQTYNQAAWHRDLPYQHFTSSSPLAINALYCVDDFTCQNGATYVLPASHKSTDFPSDRYIHNNAIQIEAPAGSFIIMDCMAYHAGGFNTTDVERRAINHVFTIPYFKQQINIPLNLDSSGLSAAQQEILGFRFVEPQSVDAFFQTRQKSD